MKFEKEDIINRICRIREEIGHENVKPDIKDIIFDENGSIMSIITSDRPEKSAVIGKGGWVVGKLKEELDINSIHVEAYPDILLREYKMKLAVEKLDKILKTVKLTDPLPLENLYHLLSQRIQSINDFDAILQDWNIKESKNNRAVVALSGGVDSSFSLIVSQLMGFNPIAVTVNPGNIILPRYFQKNVEALSAKLNVKHVYVNVEMEDIIKDSLQGRFHPCGRCSKVIEGAVLEYAKENKIEFLIYGDLLSTGNQSIVIGEDIIKINLPAMLSVTKGEIKNMASKYGVFKKGGYGCPLINEVHKKYPHMRKFSIQRVLRETRAGILEPGEALEMIMKII
ncbi:ATPase [Methanobacterium sp.]|uniref:ATPase n=1 Tax=Methanobacterium sp. TaxID=2164 RepID=UPI003C75F785